MLGLFNVQEVLVHKSWALIVVHGKVAISETGCISREEVKL